MARFCGPLVTRLMRFRCSISVVSTVAVVHNVSVLNEVSTANETKKSKIGKSPDSSECFCFAIS